MQTEFRLYSIGRIVNADTTCRIEVDEKYSDAFLGLEQFSHVDVFYWLHENDQPAGRGVLRVHPRGDKANPLTGVFATRSPLRPNPIAVTRCRIIAVAGSTLTIDAIDARDGSPLIDIKAHIPPRDEAENIRIPDWVAKNRGTKGEKT
jgi:tRNA-Thr(GGU) m(6)t(6)A37 methyltransferase TsaA